MGQLTGGASGTIILCILHHRFSFMLSSKDDRLESYVPASSECLVLL